MNPTPSTRGYQNARRSAPGIVSYTSCSSGPLGIIFLVRANVFLGVCTVTIEDVCCFQVTHRKVSVMSCNAVPVYDNVYNHYLLVRLSEQDSQPIPKITTSSTGERQSYDRLQQPDSSIKESGLTFTCLLGVRDGYHLFVVLWHGPHRNHIISRNRHKVDTQPVMDDIPHFEVITPQLVFLQVLKKRHMLLSCHHPILMTSAVAIPYFWNRCSFIVARSWCKWQPPVMSTWRRFEVLDREIIRPVPVWELGFSPRDCRVLLIDSGLFRKIWLDRPQMIMNPREGILDDQVGGDNDVFRVLNLAFHD